MVGHARVYTIYYIDTNNKKQYEKITMKSEQSFKEFIMKYGENLGEKYANICKIAFYMLIFIILLKGIVIRIQNRNIENR